MFRKEPIMVVRDRQTTRVALRMSEGQLRDLFQLANKMCEGAVVRGNL